MDTKKIHLVVGELDSRNAELMSLSDWIRFDQDTWARKDTTRSCGYVILGAYDSLDEAKAHQTRLQE